jgi:hypothetical protein
MPTEFYPESIRFTSDRVGVDAFRVLVRELPDEGEPAPGAEVFPFLLLLSGRTTLTFQDAPEQAVTMVAAPLERPAAVKSTRAG